MERKPTDTVTVQTRSFSPPVESLTSCNIWEEGVTQKQAHRPNSGRHEPEGSNDRRRQGNEPTDQTLPTALAAVRINLKGFEKPMPYSLLPLVVGGWQVEPRRAKAKTSDSAQENSTKTEEIRACQRHPEPHRQRVPWSACPLSQTRKP